MTEPSPVYQATAADDPAADAMPLLARRVTPAEGADMMVAYLVRKRDLLIAELREIDRLLGRAQTIPVRER